MLNTLVKRIFGSKNERTLKRMQKNVLEINALEKEIKALSDTELAAKTDELKKRLAESKSLQSVLVESFAVVREVSVRTLGLRHFDVQLIGGMVLNEGNIAEMRTGEGKTLVATLPAYLNALTGKGVHIVTVNDYLAKRDSKWMQPIFEFLGLSVGVIYPDMPHEEKQKAYQSDIVYGTNNEFGFDYLRDNMAFSVEDKVQRELNFAIVDEVDSILIDEARTPLIISGAAEDSSELYIKINQLITHLKPQQEEGDGGDYTIDEKQKQAHLTEKGHQNIESILVKQNMLQPGESVYHASNIGLMHHVNAALRAHALYSKDVDYIVKDNEVVIVDEHTGRTMPGRRWSEGLHQAIEAKEGVSIQNENQTLASITFQNYFRLYNKLSGMTGTADTEAYEFQQIYNLDVVVIPTNKPMQRKDLADLIYLTPEDKFQAIIEDVKGCIEKGQPVLVGTTSIETSELLASILKKEKIKHQVLNAKFHEKEAQIVAEAGRPAIVTIATNMAGRGTDIVLGGNLKAEIDALGDDVSDEKIKEISDDWQKRHDAVIKAGGLRIIGSERHESRRIDNQLRGRSGRQGDPGSSRFYLSLQDNLMRIFASERVSSLMQRLGMQPGEAIEHPWVTKAIENAQRKVEGHNFEIRKQLLQYDDVANDQRKVIYQQRAEVMNSDDLAQSISSMREEVLHSLVDLYIPPESMEEQWDIKALEQVMTEEFKIDAPISKWVEQDNHMQPEAIKQKLLDLNLNSYQEKENVAGADAMRQFEKSVLLQTLDNHWREHLASMDQLRQGIHLRGYAQKDPKQEYKREAFQLFSSMLDSLKHEVISMLSCVEIQTEQDVDAVEDRRRQEQILNMSYAHPSLNEEQEDEEAKVVPFKREGKKIGRNEPCPCGSGKKYKQCHGRLN
jgi:preprotein translocase subunit SecA